MLTEKMKGMADQPKKALQMLQKALELQRNDERPKQGAGLQGTWQGVEVWDAGKKRTAEPAKLLQIEFRGDQFMVRFDGEKMLSGRFSVDDGKTPKLLTLEAVAQDGKRSRLPSI